jgi:CheY-like chemotaxis protein
VARFRARPAAVRAVVLDMVMPGLDGRATYLELRAIRPDLPVLLMTGYALNDEVQAILDLGVRAFLQKPPTPEGLAAALAAIVGPPLTAQSA